MMKDIRLEEETYERNVDLPIPASPRSRIGISGMSKGSEAIVLRHYTKVDGTRSHQVYADGRSGVVDGHVGHEDKHTIHPLRKAWRAPPAAEVDANFFRPSSFVTVNAARIFHNDHKLSGGPF